MAYGGISTNFFGSYFGTSSSSKSNSANSLFSTDSYSGLSDLKMIQKGAYKKLLNSYYNSNDDKKNISKIVKDKDSTQVKYMTTARNDAKKLYEAAGELSDKKLYQSTGKDKDGKDTYDLDSIYKKAKSFVESYNNLLDDYDNVDNKTMVSKASNMLSSISVNKNLLSKVGISISSDSSLSIDEDKLKAASITDIKSVFTGRNSIVDDVRNDASAIYSVAAYDVASSSISGSAYTGTGSYSLYSISTFTGNM